MSGFSENRLRDIKVRLYKQFGHNLKNLYTEDGKFKEEEFHKVPNKLLKDAHKKKMRLQGIEFPAEGTNNDTYEVGPWIIDARKQASFAVGFFSGLQYKPEFAGPCVLTVIDTANSLNYFVSALSALKSDFNWFNLGVYEPVHFYSNLIATYE